MFACDAAALNDALFQYLMAGRQHAVTVPGRARRKASSGAGCIAGMEDVGDPHLMPLADLANLRSM